MLIPWKRRQHARTLSKACRRCSERKWWYMVKTIYCSKVNLFLRHLYPKDYQVVVSKTSCVYEIASQHHMTIASVLITKIPSNQLKFLKFNFAKRLKVRPIITVNNGKGWSFNARYIKIAKNMRSQWPHVVQKCI